MDSTQKIESSILDGMHGNRRFYKRFEKASKPDIWLDGFVVGENRNRELHGGIEKALMALGGDFNHGSVAKAKEILREALDTRFPPLQ